MTAVDLTEYEEYQAAGRIWGLVPRERISKIKFPRVPQATIKRYLAIDDMTTSVSDVLDSLGIVGSVRWEKTHAGWV